MPTLALKIAGMLGISPLRLIIYAALAVSALAFVGTWTVHQRNVGYRHAITDVRAANQKATGQADQGSQDVNACFERGGDWDRTNGRCAEGGR